MPHEMYYHSASSDNFNSPPQFYTPNSALSNDYGSEMGNFILEPHGTAPSGYSMDPSIVAIDQVESPRPSHAETEDYLRRTLGIKRPQNVDLWFLPEVPAGTTKRHKRPPVTKMIQLAIWGSREKRLTLSQIFEAIEERYPHWKGEYDKPWQRSIRHNLSLKAMFEMEDRPQSYPGNGNFWGLNVRHGNANTPNRQGNEKSAVITSPPQSSPDCIRYASFQRHTVRYSPYRPTMVGRPSLAQGFSPIGLNQICELQHTNYFLPMMPMKGYPMQSTRQQSGMIVTSKILHSKNLSPFGPYQQSSPHTRQRRTYADCFSENNKEGSARGVATFWRNRESSKIGSLID